MSNGLSNIIAVGSANATITRPGGHSIVVPYTGTAAYAWELSAPISTAVVSDWPGRDYANVGAFTSNSLSRYQATPSNPTAASFDAETYQGYPLLTNDRSIGNLLTSLIIPSSTSKTDIVYHVRRKLATRGNTNELVPAMEFGNYQGQNSGAWNAICGLSFDYASHAQPTWQYNTPYNPVGGIILEITTNGRWPGHYRLVASITNSGGTVLSDATSQAGVDGPNIGDEFWNAALTDYFIRSYLVGNTLNIEAYYNYAGTAPVRIGVLALTMLDASTPPMPKYGFNNWHEGYFITPALTKTAYSQIIDNATYPNTALDFAHPVNQGTPGLGDHGLSIARRTINIQQYANDAALKADIYSGTSPVLGRMACSDITTGALVTATDTPHNNQKFWRMSQALNSQASSSGLHDVPFYYDVAEIWFKESVLFSNGWSNYGAGFPVATLAQNIVGSGSAQTVNVSSFPVGNGEPGLIGYGTANVEYVNFTRVTSTTINGVFTKNHSTGDEVSQAQGPGFKITQCDVVYNTDQVSARMELVGTGIQSYFVNNGDYDSTYPSFSDLGIGGLSSIGGAGFYRTTTGVFGTATDFITTPVPNAQGATGFNGTRFAQGKELQFRGRVKVWFDADYGRYRSRIEHYIGVPGSAPSLFQYGEAFSTTAVTSGYISGMDFNENFNERVTVAQSLDSWDHETCDPSVADIGPDPYGCCASLGLAIPNVGTCGLSSGHTSSSLTYPITAPAAGSTVLHVIAEVFNGTVWIPNGTTGVVWTAGAGGTQSITVTGLTTGTNYTGLIRFRFVSSYGMGPACICSDGTTL